MMEMIASQCDLADTLGVRRVTMQPSLCECHDVNILSRHEVGYCVSFSDITKGVSI